MRQSPRVVGVFARIHQGLTPIGREGITCMLTTVLVRFLEEAVIPPKFFMVNWHELNQTFGCRHQTTELLHILSIFK
jgi:hypothetical protein